MKRLLLLGVSGLAAVVTTAVLVAPALGTSPPPRLGLPRSTNLADLAPATLASIRFQRVEQAIAAGYVIDSPCVSDPEMGGMGVHYANHALMNDPALDPGKPEILVYQPDRNGRLRLGALEYFRRAADQTPPIDQSDKPTLFGMRSTVSCRRTRPTTGGTTTCTSGSGGPTRAGSSPRSTRTSTAPPDRGALSRRGAAPAGRTTRRPGIDAVQPDGEVSVS